MAEIKPIPMPKWGLAMQEGTIVDWHKQEGDSIVEGEDLVDIETSKITNVALVPDTGILRRIVAQPGDKLPIGALIGVVADADVSDADIDAFIADYQARFVPEGEGEGAAGGLQTETVDANGQSLRVGRAGSGDATPVVFIHGFGADQGNWLFNLDAYGPDRPVIAIDLPGHGGSVKSVGDGSLATMAASVAAALDALGVTRAHLVGHSYGAAVALRVAADAPARTASVTLIAPAGLPGTTLARDFLDGVVDARRARDLKPWLEMLVSDPARITRDMIDDMIKIKRMDGVDEAWGLLRDRMLDGSDFTTLMADSAALKVRVIASSNDRIVGQPDPAKLPAGFELHIVTEGGHMPHVEKAAEVNALLAAAL